MFDKLCATQLDSGNINWLEDEAYTFYPFPRNNALNITFQNQNQK